MFSTYQINNTTLLEDVKLPVHFEPSQGIYFDQYPYKVLVEGSKIYHDIEQHYIISDWVDRCVNYFNYRHNWTNKGRSFYFKNFEDLDNFVNEFKYYVISVSGPVNRDHLDLLTNKYEGYFKPVYRKKNWFGKYPVKITIERYYAINNSDSKSPTLFADIDRIVSHQCTDYKWYHSPQFGKIYSNYLYLLEEDRDIVLQSLLLTYKQFIRNKEQVYMYNKKR